MEFLISLAITIAMMVTVIFLYTCCIIAKQCDELNYREDDEDER